GVHRHVQADRRGDVVLRGTAVGLPVLIVRIPAPVGAEAALDAGQYAHGLRLLVGPLLDLRVPHLAHGCVTAAGIRAPQAADAGGLAADARVEPAQQRAGYRVRQRMVGTTGRRDGTAGTALQLIERLGGQ